MAQGHAIDLVYFIENPTAGEVWIGFNGAHKTDRGKAHEAYGFDRPLAYMPGSTGDEAALHEAFAAHRVAGRRKSRYRADDTIYRYVAWLLERQFAAATAVDAGRLAAVPWAARSPQAMGTPDEALAGQLTLMAGLPPRDRVAYAAAGLFTKASETDEWFTPGELIEIARAAMGGIDTDPASHPDANARFIHAPVWYGKAQNGLRTDLPWSGNVWLNPPYGRGEGSAQSFVNRLVFELDAGTVKQAVTCLNSDSMTSHWFDPVWRHAKVHLVYRGRPNYWRPGETGASPTKGTVLSYFGGRPRAFIAAARPYGNVLEVVAGK